MKFLLQILFLFLTWFTNLSATAAYTKFALPSYEVSFSQTENVKEESAVKIGVVNFARNEITKNELQTTYLQVGSFYKTLFSNNEKGNFSALTFEKDLSKNQYNTFNFSKKEQLSLWENRAREDVCEVVNGAGSLDDLVSWASKNGLGNLTQAEIKGTFDLFDGNISFAQKALLSSKEIVAGKTLPELAQHFNLPTIPSAQSLTPYQARVWYSWRKSQISTLVNRSNGLEVAAREALEMRNSIRTTTRNSMKDKDIADFLNTKEVNMTWEEAMSKYNGNYEEIIQASMRGRGVVDILFQIPK